ncbi:RNA polymerase subunit AC19 [Clydaea vesicula]|uniref:DNA-directed RNA polymerases I and III subunit RPAC2 n=1 Tax=Clydaea vesicula TaxID=447962 RepID=A0AAD5XZY1_9FUNG|nr:RNA polymerase subunit AC19 [Clydaea vesicula]KAJ3384493.1 RNA polymerase subunit AC19 [Lobulomyces angularis]
MSAMLEPGQIITTFGPKVQLLEQNENDDSCATFQIKDEDHTLGNSLRYMLMKNPNVTLAGYSLPHPSEARFNLRIQTDGTIKPLDALNKGLDDLIDMFQEIYDKFDYKLKLKDYILEEDAEPDAE